MTTVQVIRPSFVKDVVTTPRQGEPVAAQPKPGLTTIVEVVSPEGRIVKDVIAAVVQPTTPATAEPVNIGLVEISQFVGQQGRQGPPGPPGATGPTGSIGPTGPAGPSGTVFIGDNAPSSPTAGQLWWESDFGNLLIYYNDGTSLQWVAANSPGPTGPPGPMGPPGSGVGSLAVTFVGPDPPGSPVPGTLWWESDSGQMFVWYEDINSTQWVPVSIGVPGPGVSELAARVNTLEARLAALEGSSP